MSARQKGKSGSPPHELRGDSLTEAQFRRALGAVDHEVDARYAWDAGVAVGRFLDGLKEGRIMARECRRCRRVLVPPRMFCEQCFRPTDAWRQVEDTGRVNTFSICYIRWDMERLKDPELPAVIEIDGASPGIGFLHKLGEVKPEDIHVGMEVEAVWKPAAEREGSILDIEYFRPRDGALRRARSERAASGRKKTPARKRAGRRGGSARSRG